MKYKLKISGDIPESARIVVNDGLNYGRFDNVRSTIYEYKFFVDRDELVASMSSSFTEIVEEMREDDKLDNEETELMKMGYPSLEQAFETPKLLADAISIFMDRDILVHYLPYTESYDYIINSTDRIVVDSSGLHIYGRCIAKNKNRV